MRKVIAAVLAVAFLLTGCGAKIIPNAPPSVDDTVYTRESAGIRLEDDFYGYQNFDLLYESDIPAGMHEWSYGQLAAKQTEAQLSALIQSLVENPASFPQGSDAQKIRDLCLACMDTVQREQDGLAALERGLIAIRSAASSVDFVQTCGMLYTDYGVQILPVVNVSQDHFDSSRNILCLGQMELFYSTEELLCGKDCAEDLQMRMTGILAMLGYEDSETLAYDAVTLLLEIAEHTADLQQLSIAEIFNFSRIDTLDPLWQQYLQSMGIRGGEIAVLDQAQLDMVAALLTEENLPSWKAIAASALLYAYRDELPPSYKEMLGTTDDPAMQEKTAGKLLAGELGNLYARKYADEDVFTSAKEITDEVISAYRKCIQGSALLSASDRAACLAKLDAMTVNIGCPDEQYHSGSVVTGSLLESAVSIRSAAVREKLASRYSKPLPTDWYMLPQSFNALCRPQSNSITIPMALFQEPFFSPNAGKYENLGGLGFIIAHEIGHFFDADGILYDEHGNYCPDCISTDRLAVLSEQVTAYFGSRQIMHTFYVDGMQTKVENAADLGGMQVIASITTDKEELRILFCSFAHCWATLAFDSDAAKQIANDVHSPAEIRVNAVLSSVDAFYTAYDITENDGMYLPPEQRVRVW